MLLLENMLFCYCVALFFLIFLVIKYVFHGNKNLPPGPPSHPIIGHLHLLKPPLHQTLQTLLQQYGPILSLKVGCRSMLVLSSPSAVEECFTKNDVVLSNRPTSFVGDKLHYNYTTITFSPYGHLWRTLRRFAVLELFSQKALNKFSSVRREEVCSLLRQLSKVSCSGTKKVDLRYFFSLLSYNIALRMSAGKKYIEEEIACSDLGKQDLKEIKKIFNPPLSFGLCDFFPAFKWIDYKGYKKSVIKLRHGRDGFLQDLVDEIRQKKTSSCSSPDAGLEKTAVIEILLSLQEQEPDFYTDDIIKGLVAPSCLSALDMESDLWTTGRCSATTGGARRNGTHQWRTGLTCGLLVDALSHPGHECRASSLRNQTNLRLLLLIVVVDDFEIAKRSTLLFSRENDFFELDDRNNLSTNLKQETDPIFFFFFLTEL